MWHYSYAQDSQNDSLLINGNYGIIKTNIVSSLLKEISISYEFGLKDYKSVELKAGYIHPNRGLDFFMVGGFQSPYFFHKGFSIGGAFKKYKVKKFNSFWKYSLAYKYEFFNDEELWLGGWGGSSYANELYFSQRKNIIQLRTEYGLSSKKLGFFTEGYVGLGLNIIHVHSIYHDCRQCGFTGPAAITKKEKPYLDNGYYIYPTAHFGFRFGGRFKQGK